jgi:hypothetical protein
MEDYAIRARTEGTIRKEEFSRGSIHADNILSIVPENKLQGNKDKATLVSDDGIIIGVYFNVGVVFDDLEYQYDNVKLVSLKYNKETGEHYYKYYVLYNPLDIPMDNIVSTGFYTNDPSKITVYVVPHLHEDEDRDAAFVLENFKGITMYKETGETIMETAYEPNPDSA